MKRTIHSAQAVFLAFVCAVLVACAGMPSSPDTFNKKLAVAVASVTTVRETAETLLRANKITVGDAKNIQAQADVAREGLNVARSMSGTDLASASGRLEAVSVALQAAQTYLLTKQGAK